MGSKNMQKQKAVQALNSKIVLLSFLVKTVIIKVEKQSG